MYHTLTQFETQSLKQNMSIFTSKPKMGREHYIKGKQSNFSDVSCSGFHMYVIKFITFRQLLHYSLSLVNSLWDRRSAGPSQSGTESVRLNGQTAPFCGVDRLLFMSLYTYWHVTWDVWYFVVFRSYSFPVFVCFIHVSYSISLHYDQGGMNCHLTVWAYTINAAKVTVKLLQVSCSVFIPTWISV